MVRFVLDYNNRLLKKADSSNSIQILNEDNPKGLTAAKLYVSTY